jgi:hypothetical protein
MALPARDLRAVRVRLKSVSNEGLFTLEAETVFRLHLHAHCSRVTNMPHGNPCACNTSFAILVEISQ